MDLRPAALGLPVDTGIAPSARLWCWCLAGVHKSFSVCDLIIGDMVSGLSITFCPAVLTATAIAIGTGVALGLF